MEMGGSVRRYESLNEGWSFRGPKGDVTQVDIPHTWNAQDGQDGGNDYWRGTCSYSRTFRTPEGFDSVHQVAYIEFDAVNASADVTVNGSALCHHDGGYSRFRVDVSSVLAPAGEENGLDVTVDNSVNDRVYPQKADFTFYGGIYRSVRLVIADATHFSLDRNGGPGIAVTPKIKDGEKDATVRVQTWADGPHAADATVRVRVLDATGAEVVAGEGADAVLALPNAHRWDGTADPYLYQAEVTLLSPVGEALDRVVCRFGVRSFSYDPRKGFFLNGRSYPLRGVSRHQDRKGIGNALTTAMHEEDIDLICEVGANAWRTTSMTSTSMTFATSAGLWCGQRSPTSRSTSQTATRTPAAR